MVPHKAIVKSEHPKGTSPAAANGHLQSWGHLKHARNGSTTHVHVETLKVSGHAQIYLDNSQSKPNVLQAHQAPCARARLVYPHMFRSHMSKTSGYLASPSKSLYFHLLLPFGHNFQVGRRKRHSSRENKMPVSLKYCCLHHKHGAGDKLWVEIQELKSCVSVTRIQSVWKWFVWFGRTDQRNSSGGRTSDPSKLSFSSLMAVSFSIRCDFK